MSSKIFEFLNLHNGEDERNKVLENVKSNISFRGANLWVLACAIVIASVGLNVNSTAVIIGAMLISPLMGPIVGAGFALAIYDFNLLKKSAKNLLIATLVSLIVAAVYFYISPFKQTQSELLSRTSPTIYDVLIAFFGGLVGVIAITRVEKGNPIPGVAIATALMPPLCTAGHGIAIGNFQYFFGAFYLYTINCFFICIATFLIIKYLKYAPSKLVSTKNQKQIKWGITLLIIIMIVPASYLAYKLVQEQHYSQKVDKFIVDVFDKNGDVLIYKKTNVKSNPRRIELAFLTTRYTDQEIKLLNEELMKYGIKNTQLIIKQDVSDLKSEKLNELGSNDKDASDKDIIINKLKLELDQYRFAKRDLIKETTILFPEFKNISIGKQEAIRSADSLKNSIYVIYLVAEKQKPDTSRLHGWLRQKLNTNQITFIQQK